MSPTNNLNPAQAEAAAHQNGPLLIIAGAGAGKTKTITHRILNLIQSGVAPENILAITFTNKAAKEMGDRVTNLLSENGLTGQGKPFMSTFHSLGVHILRHHGTALGLSKFFVILDRDESLAKVKQAMRLVQVDEKRFEPRKMLSAISKHKGDGRNAKSYAENAHDFFPKLVSDIWLRYEELLQKENALDFDDLLLKTVRLFRQDKEILEYYQDRWKYIHIDEYQDTNTIQYEISKLLADKHQNICVVGDIDQSIYSWRGADFTNILNFEKDYPETKTVLLEENYRSTQNILAAANDVIKKNRNRREKNLFTNNGEGDKITIFSALDENSEARFIAETAKDLIREGTDPEEIAVLYRANFQSRVLEEAFLRAGVPYEVLGTRFFERKEIKDIIGFLRLAFNPDDSGSLKRVINVPPRGIGKVTLDKILAGETEKLPAKMREKIIEFKQLVASIKEQASELKPSETIKYIMAKAGIEADLKNKSEEEQERLENLKEFVSLATKYDELPPEEGLMNLISEASLTSDQDTLMRETRGVRLSTIHASKGLEFKRVFITGLETDLFPHSSFGDEKRDDEEERRLFYVALTRAKEKLYLTYAQSRMVFGQRKINMPSEFIDDISEDLIDQEDNIHTDYQDNPYHNADGTTNYLDIDF